MGRGGWPRLSPVSHARSGLGTRRQCLSRGRPRRFAGRGGWPHRSPVSHARTGQGYGTHGPCCSRHQRTEDRGVWPLLNLGLQVRAHLGLRNIIERGTA